MIAGHFHLHAEFLPALAAILAGMDRHNVPVIGDALCVAAGWLRLSVGWSVFFMALGKFARYYVIARIIG